MWLVPKGATNAKGKEPLAAALRDTLRIWYTGKGNHLDEQTALVVVRHARKTGCWIACECQGDAATPMLSPALLTGADTYYLRRLTGPCPGKEVCKFERSVSLPQDNPPRSI